MNELLFIDTPFQCKLSAIQDLLKETTINDWKIIPQMDGKSIYIQMITDEEMIHDIYNTEAEADYAQILLDIASFTMPVKDLDINS